MNIEVVGYNEESIEYEITDIYGNVYGIYDTIDAEGMIVTLLLPTWKRFTR